MELSAGTHYCPYHKKKDSSGLNLKCKDCGTENPEDAQFCLECGSKLEKTQKISEDTPLKDAQGGDLTLALKVMALTRLLLPDINIPATTAMDARHYHC